MNSARLYDLITKHWPKIATALVALVGILEFLINSSASDSNIEWYLLAWGSMTGGLWFLFDIAEKVASEESKRSASNWIKQNNGKAQLSSLPERFSTIFDYVFGEKHLSWKCFRRSVMASIFSAWIVSTFLFSVEPGVFGDGYAGSLSDPLLNESVINIGVLGLLALFVNLIPDYLSLLQTRYMLNWIKRGANTVLVLISDALLTGLIFISYVCAWTVLLITMVMFLFPVLPPEEYTVGGLQTTTEIYLQALASIVNEMLFLDTRGGNAYGILLITTYFTSVWLWLYIIVMWASRVLIKLNSGLGFLLRAVDVEAQPFRSLGFVSVLVVSLLFLLGLPLAL